MKEETIRKFGFYFSTSLEGSPMEATDGEIGKVSDVVLDTTLYALPYLRVRENVPLRSRDLIVPWECIAEFSLAEQHIQTGLDDTILRNAPEAPEEEEASDSSVENAIRSYYQL